MDDEKLMTNLDLAAAARERGERFYFRVPGCGTCGEDKFYASTGQCVQCHTLRVMKWQHKNYNKNRRNIKRWQKKNRKAALTAQRKRYHERFNNDPEFRERKRELARKYYYERKARELEVQE